MLSVKNLRKVYRSKKAEEVVALDGVSIDFPETGFVFLLGKSGSGKSTLLNAIGGLDKFDEGEIVIKGKSSADFTQADFDSYRNTFIGFIFQEYNILENFSVAKNLALALELQGKKADHEEVMKLLRQVEMEQYAKRKPNELSGGQKQRVAIARALIKNPEIIMADEPTGALDSNTGKQVMDTLKELSKTKLIIVVSHDREFAELYGDRIIELKDGKILQDVTKKEIIAKETQSGIKVIDDDIVYIKKGQEISASEMKTIVDIINNKSKESDAFISFNGNANEKLKEGAKINDDGNKEKFLNTEKEDIKVKQYNPNSLKLIKSRLGFMDSFKMGASALKNKVGKLVFTILLSFLAFTVFGIFDALSQWNRAESVYQAMQINETKTVVLQKQKFRSTYGGYSEAITLNSDLEMLQNKFSERTIKGVVGPDWNNIYNAEFGSNYNSFSISSSNDPLYSTNISGFVHFTADDMSAFGFTIYKGRLPVAEDEIAISKYTMETLIKLTSTSQNDDHKITEQNIIDEDNTTDEILRIWLNGFGSTSDSQGEAKIVGVIDDKVDYSKYKDMDSEERMDSSWTIESYFRNSFMQIAYISEAKYNAIAEEGVDTYLSLETENSGWGCDKDSLYSLESYRNKENLTYGGTDYRYYSYFANNTHYRLLHYLSSNNWYLYEITFGASESSTQIYYYNYENSNDTLYDKDYAVVTDRTEFTTLFGELNANKIPSNFKEGYYSREALVAKDILYYQGGSLIDSNGNFVDIGDDSIIIRKNIAESIMGIDYETKISEGYTIDLNCSGNVLTFKIVGVSENQNYFSDKTLNDTILAQFEGCNMIVASMTGNDAQDKEFILYCEKGNNGERWTVQNATTSILDMFEDIIISVAQVFFYIAIGFAVFAALMLMNFISTSISYKKREIGVLRALGARGSDVFGIFLNESMIIAMINFVLSAIATVVGCVVINSVLVTKLGMDLTLLNVGIRQIVLILGVSALSAFIGSFLPTFKISRKRPIDAINNR